MHRFVNFKGFADARIDLERPMTVLVGPNGSGKTNAIEAIELMAYLASGQPVHAISDVGQSGSFSIRGGLQGCKRVGGLLRLSYEAEDFLGHQLSYSVTLASGDTQEILAETLKWQDVLFDAGQSTDGVLTVRFDDDHGRNGEQTIPANQTVLSQYERLAAAEAPHGGEQCAMVVELRNRLRNVTLLDPQPSRMRGYQRIGHNVLQRDGANLSAVLYRLRSGIHRQVGENDGQPLERILERIGRFPHEPFREVGFVVTTLGDVMFGMQSSPTVGLIDARLLSDGTLRAMAVLTALETCETGTRLIIEEFDNGVHPSRVGGLLEAVLETATRRKLKVLVTTHNPATLDSLPREALDGVVIAHWDAESSSAKLTALKDLPQVDEQLARGSLGDLVTRRMLETYLQPDSEEERKARVQGWLEALP
jgi:predicted ATPase